MDLLLKRAADFRGDHYDVLANDKVVGHIMLSDAARPETPWVWSLAYGQHEDRTPTHGYEARGSVDPRKMACRSHRGALVSRFKAIDARKPTRLMLPRTLASAQRSPT